MHKINAFRHWAGILEGKLELWQYAGPQNVIINTNVNCIKGISDSVGAFVTAQCNEPNYVDKRLSNWKVTEVDENSELYLNFQTEVIEAYPFVFVYCTARETLTKEGAEEPCPAYPFRLNESERWFTQSYNHSPSVMEIDVEFDWKPIEIDLEKIHFKNASHLPSLETAIVRAKALLNQVKELRAQSEALVVFDKTISFKHISAGLGVVVTVVAMMLIYSIINKGRRVVATVDELRHSLRQHRSQINHIYQQVPMQAIRRLT